MAVAVGHCTGTDSWQLKSSAITYRLLQPEGGRGRGTAVVPVIARAPAVSVCLGSMARDLTVSRGHYARLDPYEANLLLGDGFQQRRSANSLSYRLE